MLDYQFHVPYTLSRQVQVPPSCPYKLWHLDLHDSLWVNSIGEYPISTNRNQIEYFIDHAINHDPMMKVLGPYAKRAITTFKAKSCLLATKHDFIGESELLYLGFRNINEQDVIISAAKMKFANMMLKSGKINYERFNNIIVPTTSEDFKLYETVLSALKQNNMDKIHVLELFMLEHKFLNPNMISLFSWEDSNYANDIANYIENYAHQQYLW